MKVPQEVKLISGGCLSSTINMGTMSGGLVSHIAIAQILIEGRPRLLDSTKVNINRVKLIEMIVDTSRGLMVKRVGSSR